MPTCWNSWECVCRWLFEHHVLREFSEVSVWCRFCPCIWQTQRHHVDLLSLRCCMWLTSSANGKVFSGLHSEGWLLVTKTYIVAQCGWNLIVHKSWPLNRIGRVILIFIYICVYNNNNNINYSRFISCLFGPHIVCCKPWLWPRPLTSSISNETQTSEWNCCMQSQWHTISYLFL